MRLQDQDVLTREVLEWKGLHLFNFEQSSCSQKLRIFLDLKGISFVSHPVDLMANENITPFFLGINPRGLVPVLVHDGAVHIESNDILIYLDDLYPSPRLIPDGTAGGIGALLKHENDLHFDLRSLSFRFVFAPSEPPKSADHLATYATGGSGSVGGRKDAGLDKEIDYWRRYSADGGISDEVARTSALRFRTAFDELETRLNTQTFLFGNEMTVVDIAWFIYVDRLTLAGYPFARLHPHLTSWFAMLSEQPPFARERKVSGRLGARIENMRRGRLAQTLEDVVQL